MKITARKIKPFVFLLLLAVVVASWSWAFIFLYQYFYQGMAQTEQINILRKNIGLDEINTAKFQDIMNNIEKKAEINKNIPDIKNPF